MHTPYIESQSGCHSNVPSNLAIGYVFIGQLDPKNPQPKWHLDRFSHFGTGDHRVCLYFTIGRPFPPSKLPLPMGDPDPHLIHGSLGSPKSSTQMASRLVQPFLQGSLTSVTDRPTDHATRSVRIGRIYVHSTAMWPKNTASKATLINPYILAFRHMTKQQTL